MEDKGKSVEKAIVDSKLKLKQAKKAEKRADFINQMRAATTFGKMVVWLKHKWFDSILFYITLIITGCLLGIAGKIIWEVWKMIFSVSL